MGAKSKSAADTIKVRMQTSTRFSSTAQCFVWTMRNEGIRGLYKGVAIGFLAYFLFSCGDAASKALGGKLPVTEIGFFSTFRIGGRIGR